jgi:hypothetical protein
MHKIIMIKITSQINWFMVAQSANFSPLLVASTSLNSTVTHLSTCGLFAVFCSQLMDGLISSFTTLLVHQLLQPISLKPLVQKVFSDDLVTPAWELQYYTESANF